MSRLRRVSISTRVILPLAVLAVGTLVHPAQAQMHSPPPEPFKKVSTLVDLPEFVPGLGVLYVDPGTLPAGPFLAYNRAGDLVSTVYMIPLDAIDAHKAFNGLAAAKAPVDHVDVVFNAGHPGVPTPHYHIILWHVSKERASSLR
jgi:Hypothetical protein TTHB210